MENQTEGLMSENTVSLQYIILFPTFSQFQAKYELMVYSHLSVFRHATGVRRIASYSRCPHERHDAGRMCS